MATCLLYAEGYCGGSALGWGQPPPAAQPPYPMPSPSTSSSYSHQHGIYTHIHCSAEGPCTSEVGVRLCCRPKGLHRMHQTWLNVPICPPRPLCQHQSGWHLVSVPGPGLTAQEGQADTRGVALTPVTELIPAPHRGTPSCRGVGGKVL